MSYRNQFDTRHLAEVYDREQYAPGSHSELLWEMEQLQLQRVLAGVRATHPVIDYLDFATGTGRVLHFLERDVDTATGIEISPAMAERARVGSRAAVLCRDITADDDLEGTYDLITAFRFVLNAEPALRAAGLSALAARLRSQQSRLVVNNHSNLLSHKIIGVPLRAGGRGGSAPAQEGNVLSHRSMVAALDAAGLEVVARYGCGLLPGRLHNMLPGTPLRRLEHWLARTPVSRLGVNQMYVTRLKRQA